MKLMINILMRENNKKNRNLELPIYKLIRSRFNVPLYNLRILRDKVLKILDINYVIYYNFNYRIEIMNFTN